MEDIRAILRGTDEVGDSGESSDPVTIIEHVGCPTCQGKGTVRLRHRGGWLLPPSGCDECRATGEISRPLSYILIRCVRLDQGK